MRRCNVGPFGLAVRLVVLARNSGQTAAMAAGMAHARGKYLVTMDGDLQNDPADLPKLLAGLDRADCVCGSRVEARGKGDGFIRVRDTLQSETDPLVFAAGDCASMIDRPLEKEDVAKQFARLRAQLGKL